MVLFRREQSFYIKLAALASVVALATVCTSFVTERWTDATANPIDMAADITTSMSNVNYGLFRGTLVRRLPNTIKYDLFLTCIWGKNNCAWSCGSDEKSRQIEVERLVNGETPNFSCINKPVAAKFVGAAVTNGSNHHTRVFANAGIWLSTIIFMTIVVIALVASVVLSIVNSMKSPIETFFNVQGIYAANGIALVANIVALALYGAAHNIYISRDVSIYDTIVGEYSSKASLGYSYWILILPCIFEILAIFLIAMREIIVRKDRAETVVDVSVDVPETGVLF